MSDISITAANVKKRDNTIIKHGIAGATLVAANVLYQEASTKKMKLGDNDSGTAEVRAVAGLALHASLDDQPIAYAVGGEIDVGAVLTAGVDYYLSGTPGAICPRADVTTGDDPIRVGIARTTSILTLDFADPGVTL